ncbi:MAG TPA: hypothetical protein PKJ26_02410 [Candidatus Woesebacteria bacterium]|nr:hypothetical protein [Candidatus Woesebacteria bacterium]
MKEGISTYYPTALEAAAEERRLQLEAAIIFDSQEYQVGDRVTWRVPHDGVEGMGELTSISEPMEIIGEADKSKIKWGGSWYVQLCITESHPWHPKQRKVSTNSNTQSVPDHYLPGRCIELKKNQITSRTRKRFAE